MPHRIGSLERTQPSLKPLQPGKPYLIAICIGEERTQHPSVLKCLEEVACSPPTALFKEGPAVYGFRSTLSIGEISEVLGSGRGILPGDSFVLVELGADYLVVRADLAKAWLRRNVGQS